MKRTLLSILLVFLCTIFIFAQEKSKIQIAIILDTSNSMDGLIEQAKAQLWKIVNQMALARKNGQIPDLKIALYEYGNDGLPASEGYVRQVVPMTSDLDIVSEKLFQLKTYGGNEYCGYVIDKAVNQLEWSKDNGDLKMIFIAGNEPFNQGTVDYKKSCKESITKGIVVNTIFCGNTDEGIRDLWKDGADLADGKYMNIDQNVVAANIETPYDDQIIKLNEDLNGTYISYTSTGRTAQERQITQDNNAKSVSKSNLASRGVSKGSGLYDNSTWDLVDAKKKNKVKMDEVEESELPDEMKKMSKDEREKYIEDKTKERERITNEIQQIDKKRREYIAEKEKENQKDNTLNNAIIESVHDDAVDKGFIFE